MNPYAELGRSLQSPMRTGPVRILTLLKISWARARETLDYHQYRHDLEDPFRTGVALYDLGHVAPHEVVTALEVQPSIPAKSGTAEDVVRDKRLGWVPASPSLSGSIHVLCFVGLLVVLVVWPQALVQERVSILGTVYAVVLGAVAEAQHATAHRWRSWRTFFRLLVGAVKRVLETLGVLAGIYALLLAYFATHQELVRETLALPKAEISSWFDVHAIADSFEILAMRLVRAVTQLVVAQGGLWEQFLAVGCITVVWFVVIVTQSRFRIDRAAFLERRIALLRSMITRYELFAAIDDPDDDDRISAIRDVLRTVAVASSLSPYHDLVARFLRRLFPRRSWGGVWATFAVPDSEGVAFRVAAVAKTGKSEGAVDKALEALEQSYRPVFLDQQQFKVAVGVAKGMLPNSLPEVMPRMTRAERKMFLKYEGRKGFVSLEGWVRSRPRWISSNDCRHCLAISQEAIFQAIGGYATQPAARSWLTVASAGAYPVLSTQASEDGHQVLGVVAIYKNLRNQVREQERDIVLSGARLIRMIIEGGSHGSAG